MADNEEKISKFVRTITEYAEEQRNNIHSEMESFRKERLQKAEDEALADVYSLVQKETADLRTEGVREISRRDFAARRAILSLRSQIVDKVFTATAKELIEFTATPDYIEHLTALINEVRGAVSDGETTYYFTARDEALFDILHARCPFIGQPQISDKINIGGVIGVNVSIGRTVDNTLDNMLSSQREWFIKESELTAQTQKVDKV